MGIRHGREKRRLQQECRAPTGSSRSPACNLGTQVQVNDEMLGGQGPKEHVQVASGQPQGLGAGFGELDVIASRDRAPHAVHRALEGLVLQRDTGGVASCSAPRSARRAAAKRPRRQRRGRRCCCQVPRPTYRHDGHVALFRGPLPLVHLEVSEDVEERLLPHWGTRGREVPDPPRV